MTFMQFAARIAGWFSGWAVLSFVLSYLMWNKKTAPDIVVSALAGWFFSGVIMAIIFAIVYWR